MKALLYLLLVLVTSVSFSEEIERIDGFSQNINQTLQTAREDEKNILIYFGLHHCGNCDLVKKHTISSPQFKLITKNWSKLQPLEIDSLTEKLAEKYKVFAVPTFIFTDSAGEILGRTKTGFISLSNFEKSLKNITDKKLPQNSLDEIYQKLKRGINVSEKLVKNSLTANKEILPTTTDILYQVWEKADYTKVLISKYNQAKTMKACHIQCIHQRAHLSRILAFSYRKTQQAKEFKSYMLLSLKHFQDFSTAHPSLPGMIGEVGNLVYLDRIDEAITRIKKAEKEFPKNYTAVTLTIVNALAKYASDCSKALTLSESIDRKKIIILEDRFRIDRNLARCAHKLERTKQRDRFIALIQSDLNSNKDKFPKTYKKFSHKLKKLKAEFSSSTPIS